ncbi:hypothetical protein ACEQ8H_003855 [Pleosporales sp. CAS-2024a]
MFPLLALAFLALTSAVPTTRLQRQPASSAASNAREEEWTIPRLDMHMMSTNTGLPGNTWPPSSYFNTTLSMDVTLPRHHTSSSSSSRLPTNESTTTTTSTCTASFPNGTLPLGPILCTPPTPSSVLFFQLLPYTHNHTDTQLGPPRRPDLSYWLELTSALGWHDETRTADVFWRGRSAVTANDPDEPTGYLTCVEGAPLDGLRLYGEGLPVPDIVQCTENCEAISLKGHATGTDALETPMSAAVAPPVMTDSPLAQSVALDTHASGSRKDKLSPGAKAGIGISVVMITVLFFAVFVLCYPHVRSRLRVRALQRAVDEVERGIEMKKTNGNGSETNSVRTDNFVLESQVEIVVDDGESERNAVDSWDGWNASWTDEDEWQRGRKGMSLPRRDY